MATNIRKYQLLTKLYIRHREILEVLDSKDAVKATKIIQQIIEQAKAKGRPLLYERGSVPTKLFIEKLEINVDEIYQNALKEKALGI